MLFKFKLSNSLVKNSLIESVFDIHVNIFINKTLSIIESQIVILTVYTYTLLLKNEYSSKFRE